jgi:SAM-dependent methyltransferase
MKPLPAIHLSLVQPLGYVHWLGLLDQARYFRYQFRRLGAEVTIAKNRLRHDAINFVFGAHNGFDPALRSSYTCVFVNLEQLGQGGAAMSADYLRLLAGSAVVDYDVKNVSAYVKNIDDVPLAPILYAPYLAPAAPMALEDRPIDLLFIGSMNPRRREWLSRIERAGRSVAQFEAPLYGADRDHFIGQAKAVVNTHFYESCVFEQARVSHCLSLGTPVISERTAHTVPHQAFEDSVLWLGDDDLEPFFTQDFGTPAYFDAVRSGLERFQTTDPLGEYADLIGFATGYAEMHRGTRTVGPWRPTRINLGSGKDYQSGWLNLDVVARTQPDLLLDLAAPLALPMTADSETVGPLVLEAGSIEQINANNVLEHVPDLVALMSNCLRLLKVGGQLVIEVPYERAPTAWQDPTHVRAMNENSWIYYTAWFWYLGWYEHRFEMVSSGFTDMANKTCSRDQAAFMRVTLNKVETSPQERMTAQAMQPEIRLPEDEVPAWARLGSLDSPPDAAPLAPPVVPSAAVQGASPFAVQSAAPAGAREPAATAFALSLTA